LSLINNFMANIMIRLMTIGEEQDEEGQTLVEYALIIALISLLVVALAVLVKTPLTNTFTKIATALNGS